MNSLDKLRRFIPLLLRAPLGFIFLFFGIDKLLSPESTLAIIQASVFASLFPAGNAMIYLIATIEIIVGVLLICKVQIRKTALLASLLLLNVIIIAQIPQDIVLLCVSLVVAILGNDNPWKK